MWKIKKTDHVEVIDIPSNKVTRRDFFKIAGVVTGTSLSVQTARGLIKLLKDEDPHYETAGSEEIIPTVCLMCPSGCGMLGRVVDGNLVKVEGNPIHPINMGALCPKGQASPELLYNPDRIAGPMIQTGERGSGEWETILWEEAIQIVSRKIIELRDKDQSEKIGFLYGETRGQMRSLIERFMSAVGSPNSISHDSLNIEAAKLSNLFTQGIYDLPAYDLENSNYVLSFGAGILEAGRTPQRMVSGFSYMRRGRSNRGKFVIIDPRQGVSGAKADEWIPIKSGTDAALALSIANVIISTGKFDSDFTNNYAFGFDDFTDKEGTTHKGFKNYVLENYDPKRVEQITGVPASTISRIAGEFAGNSPAIALLPGKGGLLNGSLNGLYTAMAINCLNALVGSIERPGGVLTQRYPTCQEWKELPDDPIAQKGLKTERLDGAGSKYPLGRHAYQAVADRILEGYPLEVLFLYDANPVYECPQGKRFIKAFKEVPLIVSFSSFLDETAQYADLVLPEPTFLERWQDDYIEGLGYPGVGLRQPVVEPLFNTMHTGDFILKVCQELGEPITTAFPWNSFIEVIQYRLEGKGNNWEMLKELGVWVTPGYRFSRRGSERWKNEVIGSDRQGAPRDGRFDFYSRELRCSFASVNMDGSDKPETEVSGDVLFLPHYENPIYTGDPEEYPFLLNVVTLMSLGSYGNNANLPSLQEISGMTVGEKWNSWLEMNPESAKSQGLSDGTQVWIESQFGKLSTKLRLVKGLRPDVVNLPHNQGHKAIGRWARNRGVNGLEIINPESEPFTGLASLTNTRVKVYRV